MLSLANIWIGLTPQCLQGLTILEQLLISTSYMCINLIQLTEREHTHHKLKGHVITFVQEPTSISAILPLPMYRLCERLMVVFVGEKRPTEKQLKKVLSVRKNKIIAALEWLVNHNILYKKIKLDRTMLESLPENDVPLALLAMTVMININPRNVENYTGYIIDPIEEDNDNNLNNMNNEEQEYEKTMFESFDIDNNLPELRSLGMTYINNDHVSEQDHSLKLLEKMIQEMTNHKQDCFDVILMPHSNTPKNKYTDTTLLPAAFPTLFPYGTGGHEVNFHKQHIPFKQYIKHLLRTNDPKFRHHRSFIFAAFDILRRRDVASGMYLTMKQAKFK